MNRHTLPLLLLLVLTACTARREQMRSRLQYVSACNQADTVFSARWVPTVDSLAHYFSHHGTANERLLACYLQGRVRHDMGEAPQALDFYQHAAEQADTTRTDCDLHTLYAVYGQMADLFHAQYLPDDEMQALKTAERIAWKDRDTLSAIKAYELRVRPYFLREEKDSMLLIMKNAREQYLRAGHRKQAATAIYSAISICLDRQQLEEARRWLDIYEKESDNFDGNGQLQKGEFYYYDKGRYLLATGKVHAACQNFRKAIEWGFSEAGYRGLLSAYETLNQPDSMAKYAKLFAAANDSSYNHVNQEKVHQINAMYDYSRQQRMAEANARKARLARQGWVATMLIALATILVIALMTRRSRQQAKQRYQKLSADYENAKSQLAATIADQQLLSREIETTLQASEQEHREDRKRTARQHAEDMKQRAREIQFLQEKVEQLENQLNQFSSVDMEAAFKKTNIYLRFCELKEVRNIHQHPTEEEWMELTDVFRTHFVRYYSFITIDHRLPVNQYRYCVLFRIGFDGNEISILMNKDKDQRYNLRKFIYEALFGTPVNVKKLDELLRQHF